MWKVFRAEEIVDFAVQIERNGEQFYKALAEQTTDAELSSIFADLAAEEEKHIIDFQSLLENLKNVSLNESYPGEYEDYVEGLAKNHVFTKGVDEALASVKNPIDGINMALRFEQDSILFFYELKELVFGSNADIVDKLIKEEKKHIHRLLGIKNQYS